MSSENVFLIEWQDPSTKTILIVKYLKPWHWKDVVDALHQADSYFKSTDHKVTIIHDQINFPAEQSTIAAIRDIWRKLPLPPANLQTCIVVNQKKNHMLEIAFDVVEKTFFRRRVTHFVTSLEEVQKIILSS